MTATEPYRRHGEASLEALARELEVGERKKLSRTKTKSKRPKRK